MELLIINPKKIAALVDYGTETGILIDTAWIGVKEKMSDIEAMITKYYLDLKISND